MYRMSAFAVTGEESPLPTSSGAALGAAAASRRRLGIIRLPPEPDFWPSVERTTEALGPDGCNAAFAAGAALGIGEAVAYLRRVRGERKLL
jgi:hypothetical protein